LSCSSIRCWVCIDLLIHFKPLSARLRHVWGKLLFPCRCPNSLDVQSFNSKGDSSIHGLLGSYTILVLLYFFKYSKIWNSWYRCPSLGNAKWDDSREHSRQMSTHPSLTSTVTCLSETCSMQHQQAAVLGICSVLDDDRIGVSAIFCRFQSTSSL
jgi:hypothetical protein